MFAVLHLVHFPCIGLKKIYKDAIFYGSVVAFLDF